MLSNKLNRSYEVVKIKCFNTFSTNHMCYVIKVMDQPWSPIPLKGCELKNFNVQQFLMHSFILSLPNGLIKSYIN